MSFWVNVEQDLKTDATAALAAGKEILNYVDGVVTTDIIPALETAFENAIAQLGQEAVAALLGNAVPNTSSPATPAPSTPAAS